MAKGFTRLSNFELLKVLSILMVLTLHYFNGAMGGGLSNVLSGTFNYYAMYLLESMSIIAVNCFVLVTGYFMVGKNQINLRKVLNLIGLTVFYGVLFYSAIVFFTDEVFSIKGINSAVVPFMGSEWFVGSYSILFLLSPFINMLLNQLTKKEFQQLLLVSITCFSVIPTVLPMLSYNDRGYGVLTFIMLYCIGAFLKLHFVNYNSKWLYLGVYLFSTTVTFGLSLYLETAWNYNTLFNTLSAVFLFLFFSKLNFKSRTVNFLATFTFPIYIIHSDASIINILFRGILNSDQFWNSQWFLVHLIFSVIFIFIGCIAIEIVRRYLLKFFSGNLKLDAIDKVYLGQPR